MDRLDLIERRLGLIEERINELQRMLENSASTKTVTQSRVVLEEMMQELITGMEGLRIEVEAIKSRLKMS